MKKNKLILLQLVIAFTLICTSVYAAVSTTIGLSIDKSTIERGETVSVKLSLKDVDENQKVTSVEGYINYNKNVIEPITVDNIEKDEENNVKIGNETLVVEDLTNANANDISSSSAYIGFNGDPESDNDSKIVIDFNNGITEDTDLLTIKFKVKSDATIGEIKDAISYSMFVITADSEQSEEITKNINLTVKQVTTNPDDGDKDNNTSDDDNTNNTADNDDDENKNKNENKNTNTNTNTNTNGNVNNNPNTNTNTNTKDNTVSGTKIPAAGAKVIVLPAIILIVLAYVSYNKYMKMKGI